MQERGGSSLALSWALSRALAAAVSLAALSLPLIARADPRDDARRHFLAGLEYAQAGDYRAALEEFLIAQRVWPHPNTLYNIAKSYQDLGEITEALAYYRLFREAAPERAADVDPVIAVLEAQIAAARPPGDAAPIPASAADLARLATLSAELEQITRRLQQGTPPGQTPPQTAQTPPQTAQTPPQTAQAPPQTAQTPPQTAQTPPVIPPSGPDRFLDDAYQSEVVTASRYGQSPLDSPSSVTVLTAEDIRLSGATSVPELLRRVVGVEVMELSAAQPDLSIRGFNRELSNKVLVLIDGRSVYQDFLGTVLWAALPVGLADLERIEIIRGPGSAIYGANAVTGVINLITRRPGAGAGEGQGQELQGQELIVSQGSPGFSDVHLRLSGRAPDLAWAFGGGMQRRDRWSRDVDTETPALVTYADPGAEPGGGQALAQQTLRANGQVDIPAGRGLVSLSGAWAGGFTEFYTLGALGDYGFDFSAGYLRADLGWEPIHVRAFLNRISGEAGPWWQYRGEPSLRTSLDSTVADVEAEWHDRLGGGAVSHYLNAGGSWRGKWIAWDYLEQAPGGAGEPLTEHHLALFFQEDMRTERLGLVGSLRMDRHPLVPLAQTLSPRGALVWRVRPGTGLRLSGGTSFRSPTFMESYLDLSLPTEADGYFVEVSGDRELLPERILSVEAGVRDESSRARSVDAAVYWNRVTGLIDLGELQAATSAFDPDRGGFLAGQTGFVNLPEVYDALGAELDVGLYPTDGLELYANAAYSRVLPEGATSTLRLNGGVQYRAPFRMDFGWGLHWLSEQDWALRSYDASGALQIETVEIPDRLIWEARVAGRPLPPGAQGDALEVALTAWNVGALTNARFQEHPKGQYVGGRIFGTVGWRF